MEHALSANYFGLWIGIIVIITAAFVRYQDPFPVQLLRLKVFDFYQNVQPRQSPQPSPVIIADIDEYSLKRYGQWPWPRALLAKLLDNLQAAEAAVVGFDTLFPESDRTSPSLMLESLLKTINDDQGRKVLEQFRNLPNNDILLARAMTKIPTVVGQSGIFEQNPVDAENKTKVSQSALSTSVAAFIGGNPRQFIPRFPSGLYNIGIIERAAKGRGVVSLDQELDGFVRRVPLVMGLGNVIKPSFAIEVLRIALNGNSFLLDVEPGGISEILLQSPQGNFFVPTDLSGRLWVYFSEQDVTSTDRNAAQNSNRWYISAASIIDGEIDPSRLRGRIVLVGTSAIGLLDIKSTPVSPRMPGVEVHANVIENILTNSTLSYPYWMKAVEISLMLVMSLLQVLFLPRTGPVFTLTLSGGVVASASYLSWYLFATHKIYLDVTYLVLTSILLLLILNFTNFTRNEIEKNRVRRAFNQYLNPQLVENLAASPENLRLGGEKREMTIMFSDIRRFTSISEHLADDPVSLTELVNDLLTPQTEALLKNQATIDKYIGDCIMAFWNAPLDDPNHEANACRGALEMTKSLREFNARLQTSSDSSYADRLRGLNVEIRMGIGICTGEVVVGNMGSEHRFNYSVLGDPVNTSSRLESQTKNYGTSIILADQTAQAAQNVYAMLEIDTIILQGKTMPMRIYTLLGDEAVLNSEAFEQIRHRQNRFLKYYRSGQWVEAVNLAESFLQTHSPPPMLDKKIDEQESKTLHIKETLHGYYARMSDRLRSWQEKPPKNFDGFYFAEEK